MQSTAPSILNPFRTSKAHAILVVISISSIGLRVLNLICSWLMNPKRVSAPKKPRTHCTPFGASIRSIYRERPSNSSQADDSTRIKSSTGPILTSKSARKIGGLITRTNSIAVILTRISRALPCILISYPRWFVRKYRGAVNSKTAKQWTMPLTWMSFLWQKATPKISNSSTRRR